MKEKMGGKNLKQKQVTHKQLNRTSRIERLDVGDFFLTAQNNE